MSHISEQAKKIASAAEMPGVIWETVISAALTALIGWLTSKCDPDPSPEPDPEPSPETTRERLQTALEQNPRRVQNRVEHQLRVDYREQNGRRAKPRDIQRAADKLISQALEVDEATFSAVVAEAC